jgi:DNA-binding response OmpR family regulator
LRGILFITEKPDDFVEARNALEADGYRLRSTRSDEDSLLDAATDVTPEIIVVDCRSNKDRLAASRRLLKTECKLKELLVIALLTIDQAKTMEWAGIDDFLLHPCNGAELAARVKLLMWRTRNIKADNMIKIDGLVIDLLNYEVSVDGEPVELTYKEYELLRFLATRRGRVFTRESLLDHVWGYDYYGGTRTVDVHIRRLRAKLGENVESLIETVRNVGYRFTA